MNITLTDMKFKPIFKI